MVKITKVADSLDGWPQEHEFLTVQCAGASFVEYQKLASFGDNLEGLDETQESGDSSNQDDATEGGDAEKGPKAIDLFALSEKQLAKLNYYQVLALPYKPNITPDDVKKAYRKASLKYHPDKSGRGEEDVVFLKVKAAFETLTTQKQAYDSTEMPFDESIPSENTDDFFKDFGKAFTRNLHFDARLLTPTDNGNNNGANGQGGGKKKNRRKSRNNTKDNTPQGPPSLGDDDTPLDEVHAFYDYWTHFTSWRDFGLQAARELETTEHLENAESRYEKRWYQKEIDRKAKKLKQQEQARITSLVERAMAIDPRLVQERKRLLEEKEAKQKQREQEALDKKRQEEEAKLAEEKRIQDEKDQKAQDKLMREKEKKMLRKAKQAFRKLTAAALEALGEKEYALEDASDIIFEKLTREQLVKFTTKMEKISSNPQELFDAVKTKSQNLVDGVDEEDNDEEEDAPALEPEAPVATEATTSASSVSKKTKVPFTKDELSVLAKGIKKYPAGGANRWDQIAAYINSVCQPETPRTKEECIEIYNQNKTKGPPGAAGASDAAATTNGDDADAWTEEQDQQLQEGLAKYPADMDKNERWTNIANGVTDKTKKQCVDRFKVIRDALKNKK